MQANDYKIWFTALAFISVLQAQESMTENETEKVLRLSKLIEQFCSQYAETVFPALANDKSAPETDALISSLLNEMRSSGAKPQLSRDQETLVRLYDRLHQRNFRNKNWLFYARASASDLIPLIQNALSAELRKDF